MKKLCSVLLTLALCLALLAPVTAAGEAKEIYPVMATNNTIVVSNGKEAPDAHVVRPAVYKIEGANYIKLRDLAMLLRDSEKQFSVDYDKASKTVSIATGKSYMPIGNELTGAALESGSAIPSNNAILIDGEAVSLRVFKIDGANYFKLRDLGEALDFHVGYDDETKIVYISGARGYEKGT